MITRERALFTRRILVTGGAGYIGSVLVPRLLARGEEVTVFDLFFYGRDTLAEHPGLTLVEGDLRDHAAVDTLLRQGRFDSVIHLAAISNDPSSELDADLTRAVNLDGTRFVMEAASRHGVKRFVYASSASVYGIKDVEDVTEDLPLDPITIYAQYKAEGEGILNALVGPDFCGVSVRAATVCGASPRLRLDLTINILTLSALTRDCITVFGGKQMRPNVHIQDLADFYTLLLDAPADKVAGQAFNVSHSNATVLALAEMIAQTLNAKVRIDITPSDDPRSYHLSAGRAQRELGFDPRVSLSEAVTELRDVWQGGGIPDLDSSRYRNVRAMQEQPEFWRWPG